MKIYLYILLLLPIVSFGHPHTFLDVHMNIKAQHNIIKTIQFKWVFDDMTSQLLVMEFDQNGNGKIDPNEIAYIKDNYFDYLKQFSYYTDVKISNKSQEIKPYNFKSYIQDMKIVYQFELTFNCNKKDLKIEVYDEDMFTALMLKDKFVTSNIKFKISDVDNDIYFGYKLEFQ